MKDKLCSSCGKDVRNKAKNRIKGAWWVKRKEKVVLMCRNCLKEPAKESVHV